MNGVLPAGHALFALQGTSGGLAAAVPTTYGQPTNRMTYQKWLGAISGVNRNMAPRTY